MKSQLKMGFTAIAVLLFTSGFIYPQSEQKASQVPKPPEKTCTVELFNAGDPVCELSSLRIKSRVDDVNLSWDKYQQSLQALSQQAEVTKQDNRWDAGVQFDMRNAKFIVPAPPKPEEKKPEPKK